MYITGIGKCYDLPMFPAPGTKKNGSYTCIAVGMHGHPLEMALLLGNCLRINRTAALALGASSRDVVKPK